MHRRAVAVRIHREVGREPVPSSSTGTARPAAADVGGSRPTKPVAATAGRAGAAPGEHDLVTGQSSSQGSRCGRGERDLVTGQSSSQGRDVGAASTIS
ncbi:hypothetical protein JIX56_42075 [Streptomyces sp. CA-210063]|uniref:hypothetical protein n=1 Tax=Streptomyces sp. CA-210063 TaxID=2801029 RepID=UPI00214AA3CF|nr:hypothetical protein [Streptomyces sp. CA-210063]UUU35897.1 hypothetical protein JIX56_42075 [Streptomyces sp. CA-210063]